jgi:hypothetical protein
VEHTPKEAVCSDGGATSDCLQLGVLILMGYLCLCSLDFVFGPVDPNLGNFVRMNLQFYLQLICNYVTFWILSPEDCVNLVFLLLKGIDPF